MIRRATHADVLYLEHLQKRFSNAVGYVSRRQYAGKVDRGDAWLTTANDDPAGMLIAHVRGPKSGLNAYRWPPGIAHITQAAIELDLQRSLRGAQLVAHFASHARAHGAHTITCTVRDGLPAHAFWRALGFVPRQVRLGGSSRRKVLIDYAASPDSVSIATSLLTHPSPTRLIDPPIGG